MSDGRWLNLSDVWKPMTAGETMNVMNAHSQLQRNNMLNRIAELELQDTVQNKELVSNIGKNLLTVGQGGGQAANQNGGNASPLPAQPEGEPMDMTRLPTNPADSMSADMMPVQGGSQSNMIQTPYGMVSRDVLNQTPEASSRMLAGEAQTQEAARRAQLIKSMETRREILRDTVKEIQNKGDDGLWQSFWENAAKDPDPMISQLAGIFKGSKLTGSQKLIQPMKLPSDPEEFKAAVAEINAKHPDLDTRFLVPGGNYEATIERNKLTKLEPKKAMDLKKFGGKYVDQFTGKLVDPPPGSEWDDKDRNAYNATLRAFGSRKARITKEYAERAMTMPKKEAELWWNSQMDTLKSEFDPQFEAFRDMPGGWTGWDQAQNIDAAISYMGKAGDDAAKKQERFNALVNQGSYSDLSLSEIAERFGVPYQSKAGTVSEGGKGSSVDDYMRLLKIYFPDAAVPTAAKVMMAESGGQSIRSKTQNKDGTYDHGLMQINDVNVPVLTKAGIIKSVDDLYDPEKNIQAAAYLYRQSGWKPWKSSQAKWGGGNDEVVRKQVTPSSPSKFTALPLPGSPARGYDEGGKIQDKSGKVLRIVKNGRWVSPS